MNSGWNLGASIFKWVPILTLREDTRIVVLGSFPTWTRHPMETPSALLALCEGNPSVTDGFPSQRVSDAGFEVSFTWTKTKGCANSRVVGDMRGHDAHCNVKVMSNGRQGKIRYYGQCKSSFSECICSPIHATPCEIDVNRFAVKALCVVYWRMTQSVNMMAKVNLFDHESCSFGMARIHACECN